ncbi:MAG TPA: NUDIX domain-containing protein [Vicinamibacterales bacterium]|nr:NUDIX domain-containing protein [Vicinamibacterales bacterium]
MPSTHKASAGLLLFRRTCGVLEVLLAHPGGPHWEGRHEGAWSLPKGGIDPGEDPLSTARREFTEETGFDAEPPFVPLGHVVQRGGKTVHAWAFEGQCDLAAFRSVTTHIEWPPRSGRQVEVPEIDRVAFFEIDEARRVINVAQAEFLERLISAIG